MSFSRAEIFESIADDISTGFRSHTQFLGRDRFGSTEKFSGYSSIRRSGGRERFCGLERDPASYVEHMRRAGDSPESIQAELRAAFPGLSMLAIFRTVNAPFSVDTRSRGRSTMERRR